ncbi:MAG TPA: T9SS type A sorting domain-containing protein [Bacteroides sp.]|nr:T9SS type A sorting domain-containing protein [Bacteroides sp.]
MKHTGINYHQLGHVIAPVIFSLIVIFIASLRTIGQGTVTDVKFYSNSLEMERNVQIYLPEGYNDQDSVRYPVIYFLHGATLNHTYYQFLSGILNTLIGGGLISPVIVVKPDGSAGPWGGSFYTNSELYGNFEDYIVNDLTEFIDSHYRTITSRDKRSITGHSMGGYGAMKLALKHPEKYCAVASHSAPLDFSHWPDRIPGVIAENGGTPVSEYLPRPDRLRTFLFYTLAGAFSPNLDHMPYQVDFPLDSMGNLIDSVFSRWMLHDPVSLAAEMDRSSCVSVYFDCGLQDELLTYPFNTGFASSLDQLGMAYDFRSFTGGHMDQLAARVPVALQFLDSAMNKCGGELGEGVWSYKSPMPTARCFLGACVLHGKIYAIGGSTSAISVTSALEVYDPITDTWVQKASMPVAMCYPNVCVLDGKIYVFGGNKEMFGGLCTDVFMYDPGTDEWTQMDDSQHAFGDPGIAVVNGLVYLIGGAKEGAVPVSDLHVYDPSSGIWTKKADMPTPRSMLDACMYENKIYCVGGTSENWTVDFYPNVEVYDPIQDTWVAENDLPVGRWSPSACVLDQMIYVTGGHFESNACDRLDILEPVSGEWSSGTPMLHIRQGHEACVLDGKIYVLGGSYADNGMPVFLSSVETYGFYPSTTIQNVIKNQPQDNAAQVKIYPNPFHSSTTIFYSLSQRQLVNISMFDARGRQIADLVSEVEQPGEHAVTLNSEGMIDGIYFCHFTAGGHIQTKKCVLLSK